MCSCHEIYLHLILLHLNQNMHYIYIISYLYTISSIACHLVINKYTSFPIWLLQLQKILEADPFNSMFRICVQFLEQQFLQRLMSDAVCLYACAAYVPY